MSCVANLQISDTPMPYPPIEGVHWYALYTNARHENAVADHLISKDIEVFVPTITVVRLWKDRRVKLTVPAFPGYVFTKIRLSQRVRAVSAPGVVRMLSFNGVPAQLDEAEIENIRLCHRRGALMESRPLCGVGARVRVKSGVLEGLEGFVSRCKNEQRLIIPLSNINQSLAVHVDVSLLELAETPSPQKAHNR